MRLDCHAISSSARRRSGRGNGANSSRAATLLPGAQTLTLMRRIDELFLRHLLYGTRRVAVRLRREGVSIGRRLRKDDILTVTGIEHDTVIRLLLLMVALGARGVLVAQ